MSRALRTLLALGVSLPLALGPALAAAQDAPVTTAPAEAPAAAPQPAPVPTPVVDPPAPQAPGPTDAIGALIERSGGAEIDEDTAEHVKPEAAAPAHVPTSIAPPTPVAPGYTPAYERPVPSGITRPVMLHETGVSPDGPPGVSEMTYESRVRGGIAAAQGLQGPLDGAWTLNGPDGGKLYALQMVDPAGGYGQLEGAWRDLKRGEGIGAVGVIDDVQRVDGVLTLRFFPRGLTEPVLIKLSPSATGAWTGELTDQAGATQVTLLRDGPAPTAGYAVLGVASGAGYAPRPYDPTPRYVAPRKPAAKAKASKSKKKKATTRKSSAGKKKAAPKLRKTKA